jgi:hypothetical protein
MYDGHLGPWKENNVDVESADSYWSFPWEEKCKRNRAEHQTCGRIPILYKYIVSRGSRWAAAVNTIHVVELMTWTTATYIRTHHNGICNISATALPPQHSVGCLHMTACTKMHHQRRKYNAREGFAFLQQYAHYAEIHYGSACATWTFTPHHSIHCMIWAENMTEVKEEEIMSSG